MFPFITSLAGMVKDEKFGFRSELYYYLIFNGHSHSVFAEEMWTLPSEMFQCQGSGVALRPSWWEGTGISPHSRNVSRSRLSPSLLTPFRRVKTASLLQVRISHTRWELSSETHVRTSLKWDKDIPLFQKSQWVSYERLISSLQQTVTRW